MKANALIENFDDTNSYQIKFDNIKEHKILGKSSTIARPRQLLSPLKVRSKLVYDSRNNSTMNNSKSSIKRIQTEIDQSYTDLNNSILFR